VAAAEVRHVHRACRGHAAHPTMLYMVSAVVLHVLLLCVHIERQHHRTAHVVLAHRVCVCCMRVV
jgi:hypothetical protein